MYILILTISVIILIIDIVLYQKQNKKVQISPQNKILFHKLKKQSLNNISINDMEQLRYFISKEIKERKNKK